MSEIITESVARGEEPKGHIKIADEVVASIASTAVLEADGVAGMAGYFGGRKKAAKGVALKIEEGKVRISIAIMVYNGVKIQAVAKDVQQKVKDAVETMTGFVAEEINVHVSGLVA